MGRSIGILIIGSLYWDPERQPWRDERLLMDQGVDVGAPIRHGKKAETRDNTYTMVFSRGCPPGQARVVRCRNEVRATVDLIAEAEYLWAAERKAPRNGAISAPWGCVALLGNPERDASVGVLEGWSARVPSERRYPRIAQAGDEGELVTNGGRLQLPWPASVSDGRPVGLDLLLATANQPTLTGTPAAYPAPAEIAAAWRDAPNCRVEYFRTTCGPAFAHSKMRRSRRCWRAEPTNPLLRPATSGCSQYKDKDCKDKDVRRIELLLSAFSAEIILDPAEVRPDNVRRICGE